MSLNGQVSALSRKAYANRGFCCGDVYSYRPIDPKFPIFEINRDDSYNRRKLDSIFAAFFFEQQKKKKKEKENN